MMLEMKNKLDIAMILNGLKQNVTFYPDMKNQQIVSLARWVFLSLEGINTFEFQGHWMVTGGRHTRMHC
ncbi:hypothetical protein C6H66_03345 [Photorhabdus hindustanensis]|uniref:Uncharacterized protein n=1 Tax=Photorhabdus hindustanensis TaxID=2918802 RepID=A0A2S8Q750_9GAMM|nr:hypothetical protein [Photorhabdus hindustanensis]PQQ28562.1 hypothetical protein C6H66_03345 [Photorhabdus hindustanensis]